MATYNVEYNADIVLDKVFGGWNVWHGGDCIANVEGVARDLIILGANLRKMTVFDTVADQYVTGTSDQLDR